MIILGFKAGGHDPSMVIIRNGEVARAAEEERFNRIKHSHSVAPLNAIKWGLKSLNLNPQDVDIWAIAQAHPVRRFILTFLPYLKNLPSNKNELIFAQIEIKKMLSELRKWSRKDLPYQKMFRDLNVKKPKLIFIEHHTAHGLSASLFGGISKGLSVSLDGKGDGTSLMVSTFDNRQMSYFKWKFTQFKVIKFFWLTGLPFFKIRKKFDPRYSLGLGFTQFTKYLGFEPNDGEYKVMGLASYGAPVYDLDKIFGFYNGIPSKKITSYIHWNKKSRHFLDFFSIDYRLPESAITSFHQNVAASVQHNLEKSVLNFSKINLQKFRKKNLVISGGVGLNVKLNMCLRTDLDLEGLYVQPVSSDSGLSLGTAGAAYKIFTNRNPKILNSLHLGPDISEFPISRFYENKLTITEITDGDELLTFVAREISMGAVIAWMQGRMEFGPRSLGARSILADPRRIENRDKVNAKIKFREQFRPFCPSMLKSDFLGYIESSSKWRISKSLPFMIDAFRANEKAKIEIPAVVHVDGTFRPQVLDEDTHPGSEQAIITLLKKFKDLTGVGVLLNTSLNRRGEPIACNPDQGVDILMNTELDFLVIGNKIIKLNPLVNSIK